MTLNGIITLILHYFTEFSSSGDHYVKVDEDRLIRLQQECSPNNLVFSTISLMAIFTDVIQNECIIERQLRDTDPLCDSLSLA